jgi:transmembrane sensor
VGLHRNIERAAAVWLVRREGQGWREADQAELEAWLSASTAHRVAFVRLQNAWSEAGRLKVLGRKGLLQLGERRRPSALCELSATPSLPRAIPGYHGRVWGAMGASIAASLLLAAILAAWLSWPPSSTAYRTDIGGISAIAVKDGSTITLNTDSGIRIALSDTERRIDLDKGEAFFEVAKDPKRPFVVRVGDQRVIAVGTKFSVRREQNGIRVIVTEGRVRVEHSAAHRPPETAMISPGGVAVAGIAGVLVQDKPLSDVEERLSWRQGTLVFHDTSLTEAVAEFNRYNTRQIAIEDPDIGALRIGGQFRTNNAQGFVRLLADAFPIQIEVNDTRISLRHR